eukprot:8696857-Pyramimonas_sp.AAC.1
MYERDMLQTAPMVNTDDLMTARASEDTFQDTHKHINRLDGRRLKDTVGAKVTTVQGYSDDRHEWAPA